MSRNILQIGISFIFFIFLQVLIFRNIFIFGHAACFIYIGFLLLLPFEYNAIILILAGFLTGITIDVFYDTLGIHAASSVLAMFIRSSWVNVITPRGGYEIGAFPSISIMGFQWYLAYALPLIFIHHLALYFIEASGFSGFFFTFSKILSSTVFTFIILVLGQYLVYKKRP